VAELEANYNSLQSSIASGVHSFERMATSISSAGNSLEDFFTKSQAF